jgi:cytochrome c556
MWNLMIGSTRQMVKASAFAAYFLAMVVLFAIYILLMIALLGGEGRTSAAWAAEPAASYGNTPAALPEALDSLYPPKADRPHFLLGMLELDSQLSGIIVDLAEGDGEGAAASVAAFRAQYLKLAAMVPEWGAYYPQAPVEELEAAMAASDRQMVMAAYGRIGGLCHSCHAATMVPVQQKYHWRSFRSITATDPVLNQATDYASLKRRLSANLSGIGHDLRQGQIDNARKQFAEFKARSEALKETCLQCHDTEGRHFVDAAAQARIAELAEALADDVVQVPAVDGLVQSIGRENCSKCHLVHVPAAMSSGTH